MIEERDIRQKTYSVRTGLVTILILLVFVLILSRLIAIQLFDTENLRGYADSQGLRSEVILPERGKIYDRHGRILADNIIEYSIGARYIDLLQPENTYRALAEAFDKTPEYYRNIFKKENAFYMLESGVRPEIAEKLQANKACHGLKYDKKMSRFYPYQDAAGQVLGFLWDDGSGQAGIEQYYENVLRGEKGYQIIQRDKRGKIISAHETNRNKAAIPGGDVYLTLDIEYQIILEEELANTVRKTKGRTGMGVIMDPRSGEILAMANYPSFNPNQIRNSTPEIRRNRIIADQFEPGSVFKFIPVSAALEKGIFTPESRIFCENGVWRIKDRTLHDTKEHEWLSIKEILVYSSNIGAAKIAEQVGNESLYDIARKYGFGEATAVGLWGETAGLLKEPQHWSGISFSQIAMGQGVTVTLLQMMSAYSAIANGGMLLKPFIVSETYNNKQKKTFEAKISPVRRVISKNTAATLRSMLEEVVTSGTGTKAYIEGYHVAGKTGTAQKTIDGKYSNSKYYASFIGFLPSSEPVLVCGIVVDEPAYGLHHGSTAAAPAVHEVFTRIINTANFPALALSGSKAVNTEITDYNAADKNRQQLKLSIRHREPSRKTTENPEPIKAEAPETSSLSGEHYDIIMPDVLGMPVLNAEQMLLSLGLQVKRESERGRVSYQYPAPGSALKENSLCRLEVAS